MQETTAPRRRFEESQAGSIEARQLVRRFGDVLALDEVSLAVPPGEFFSLLGPSGCGKTTLLRILAGLDQADAGEVRLGGRNMASVPAHRRPVNTVFQSYALFPHLDVWQNVAFGLRMKKVPSPDLARRKPHQLSGGQKQRAALARAIVNEPEVLLLDEPLAALDVKLRRDLQSELHALQRRLGITFIHVTHDQDEALSLSDRLAVMNAGRIVQCGTPEEVYARPRNRFVAQFIGGCNLLEATPVNSDGASVLVRTALGDLQLKEPVKQPSLTLAIRPERLVIGRHASGENQLQAEVLEASFTGPETLLRLCCRGMVLKAALPNAHSTAHVRAGDIVTFHLPPEALMMLED